MDWPYEQRRKFSDVTFYKCTTVLSLRDKIIP